jgi:hypothetical protein
MTEARDDKLDLVLQRAADVWKFEIDLFWRRSLFFWGFLSAAFIACGTLSSQKADPDVIFAIACFGIICSLTWTLVNRGSKYWHKAWEQKLLSVQAEALGQDLYFPLRAGQERRTLGRRALFRFSLDDRVERVRRAGVASADGEG